MMNGTNPESFFRLLWRWHFWIGLIVAPTLIAVSVSGALFIFKDDWIDWQRADRVFVSPQNREPLTIDDQLHSFRRNRPLAKIGIVTIPAEPNRSTMLQFQEDGAPIQIAYVNPYSGEILGSAPLALSPFWAGCIAIHRNLFAGYFGRILVELTTAWCIVLIASGMYLWIPKRWRLAGVWIPRWRAHRYTVLRDWHTIPGVYFGLIGVILCVTGLFFSPLWKSAYNQVTGKVGQYPASFITPPPATATPLDRSPIPLSAIVRAAHERLPGRRLMIVPPSKPIDPYQTTIFDPYGMAAVGVLAMDRTTGEIVADLRESDVPFPGRARIWVPTIHFGTIGGMTTKVIAALTCLFLAFAAISGMAMWLVRRRKGSTGFPHRTKTTRIPYWGGGLIVVISLLLPIVAISLVVVLLGEWIYGKLTRTG